jgi:UDP-N-acetylmuramate dehydrogenase
VLFADLTTMGVGGPARNLVDVPDVETLRCVLAGVDKKGVPVLVLGGGSNLVVSDEGFAGTVARITVKGCHVRGDGDFALVEVAAGEDWWSFVRFCIGEGLSGLECLAGIPGLAGATPIQNVGAYGQEVSQVIAGVTAWDRQVGRLRELAPAQCGFAYRTSAMKGTDRFVVTSVTFRLERSALSAPLRYGELAESLGAKLGDRPPLAETAAAVVDLRRRKGMVIDKSDPDTRSAGSFFMNPVLSDAQMSELTRIIPDVPRYVVTDGIKVPAAWLVERAGFPRGYRLGRAAISSKHALAITAEPGASASEVLALARQVRDGVERLFGVHLEPEPVLVGLYL